jgi:hypothetical protein
MRGHWSFVGCLVLAAGCSRKASTLTTPSAAASASAPAAAVAGRAPSASAAPASAARPQHPAERFLLAWSSALDRRAVAELEPFYASQVIFYGHRESAAEVVAAKRGAFAKVPDYRQRVGDVHIQKGPNGFVVRFEKRSGPRLESVVPARLVLESQTGKLSIVEESDDVTDQRLKTPPAANCADAVNRIVNAHPVIEADEARVARENPEVNAGGLSYDDVEHADRFSASQGYFHEDHYEPRWWIDAADGTLTIRDAYTGELLVVTPKQQAVVRKLCTGEAENADAATGN